jgi:hypothetical protein
MAVRMQKGDAAVETARHAALLSVHGLCALRLVAQRSRPERRTRTVGADRRGTMTVVGRCEVGKGDSEEDQVAVAGHSHSKTPLPRSRL